MIIVSFLVFLVDLQINKDKDKVRHNLSLKDYAANCRIDLKLWVWGASKEGRVEESKESGAAP